MIENNSPQQINNPRPSQGILREAVNFMRIPLFQHSMAIPFIGALAYNIEELARGYHYESPLEYIAPLLQLATVLYNENQAVAKYKDYRKVKAALEKHGWDERLIEPKSHSWCQRRAARAAAIDTGHKGEIDNYFREQGYRWYHVIPYTRLRSHEDSNH